MLLNKLMLRNDPGHRLFITRFETRVKDCIFFHAMQIGCLCLDEKTGRVDYIHTQATRKIPKDKNDDGGHDRHKMHVRHVKCSQVRSEIEDALEHNNNNNNNNHQQRTYLRSGWTCRKRNPEYSLELGEKEDNNTPARTSTYSIDELD